MSGRRRVEGANVDVGDGVDAAEEHILPRAPIEGRIAVTEAIVGIVEHGVSCCRRRVLN